MRLIFAVTALASAMAAASILTTDALARQDAPDFLDISSDDQEILDQQDRVRFIGNVNAIRGDTRLRADEAEAQLARNPETGQRRIERITAQGDVFYVTATETARGDRAVYTLSDEVIVLTGAVVLTQGCNVSTGQELRINLQTGVSRLTGGNGRVRSLFFSQDGERPAASGNCPAPPVPGPAPRSYSNEFPDGQSGAPAAN
ncbi:MAG: LptA/OstA family protein [Glycocaulis sp.]|uniref:LptA/OstA family protein n=1 Tax=Glycocaulis sp. TaxID=1969725 RepID=UPI003F6FD7EB